MCICRIRAFKLFYSYGSCWSHKWSLSHLLLWYLYTPHTALRILVRRVWWVSAAANMSSVNHAIPVGQKLICVLYVNVNWLSFELICQLSQTTLWKDKERCFAGFCLLCSLACAPVPESRSQKRKWRLSPCQKVGQSPFVKTHSCSQCLKRFTDIRCSAIRILLFNMMETYSSVQSVVDLSLYFYLHTPHCRMGK